jgi:hypothetical protein
MKKETAVYVQRLLAEHENNLTTRFHCKLQELIESELSVHIAIKQAHDTIDSTNEELKRLQSAMQEVKEFIK